MCEVGVLVADDRKGKIMRHARIICCAMVIGFLAACSNPHKEAAKAQKQTHEAHEEVARERLELVDKYQACVADASGNVEKIEACDSYLRAAEALK